MKHFWTTLVLTAALVLLPAKALATETEIAVTGPPEVVKAGESFSVTVDLSGNPGFGALQFTLVFDQTSMDCTDAAVGALLQGVLSAANPKAAEGAIVAAASVEAIQGDGTLGIFHFTATADLEQPQFHLEEVLLADADGEDLPCTLPKTPSQAQNPPSSSVQPAPESSAQSERPTNPERPTEPENPANMGTSTNPAGSEKPSSTAQMPSSADAEPAGSPEFSVTPEGPEEPSTVNPSSNFVPSFRDTGSHWAKDSIQKAAVLGLLSGYADGTFRPDGPVTRGQMAVILWRMAERPQPKGSAPFADIAQSNDEFQRAIAWGYETGLLNGTSPTTYAPGEPLTRQAAMKLLYGYAGGKDGPEATLASTYDAAFSDSGQMAVWAREPMYWAVYHGILKGTSQNAISPKKNITRAQLSTILLRYLEHLNT